MSLLSIEDLSISIRQRRTSVQVLSSINLSVAAGEVCALVGESGAGKSMIAKAVLDLLPDAATINTGRIQFQGTDLRALSPRQRLKLYGHDIALIPQDPMVSLNPVRRIQDQVVDGIRLHLGLSRKDALLQAGAALEEVLIRDPERVLNAYTHELSGGMRQRVLIAMAFASKPKLIIADEPTTALDVTVQRRVLSLIKLLQKKYDTAILFVSHDLGVVAKLCDRVVVMYGGHILEDSPTSELFAHPGHEYTKALLSATPRYDRPNIGVTPVPVDVLSRLHAELGREEKLVRSSE